MDVAIVGRSVAAIAAALEASRQGARVALIDPFGPGMRGDGPDPDLLMEEAISRSRRREPEAPSSWRRRARAAAQRRARRWAERLRAGGVRILAARMRFASGREILLESGRLRFERAIVATGCSPRHPAWTRSAPHICLDPHRLFENDAPIRSALVVGGGDTGCELALLLARYGARVTLVDERDRLLRGLDRLLREALHAALHAAGIEVVLGEAILGARAQGGSGERHAEVRLGSGRIERCDAVIVSLGMLARVEHLGLEAIGVPRSASGALPVDERWATPCATVLAVGAAAGTSGGVRAQWLQGHHAARAALALEAALPGTMPMGIRCDPVLASAGLTEEACDRLGIAHDVHLVDVQPVDRRTPMVRLKLVVDARGALLGVHGVGPGVERAVQAACHLIDACATLDDLQRPSRRVSPVLQRAARLVDESSLPAGKAPAAQRP